MPKYLVKFNQAFCDALSQHASLCDKTGTPFVSPEQYVYLNTKKSKNGESFAIHHFHPNANRSNTPYRPKEAFAKIAKQSEDLKPFIESEITAEGLPSMSFGRGTLFWSNFLSSFTKKMSEKTTESHEFLISQSIQQAIEDSFDKENANRIVPITPLRIAYAEKHKDEMNSERLIQDFRESLFQYEKYQNENDLFLVSTDGNSGNKNEIEAHLSTVNHTAPDKAPIYLKRTLHLAYRKPPSSGDKEVNKCTVALQKYIIDVKNTTKDLLEKSKLYYVDAEVDFRRTTSGIFADGSSAKSSAIGGVDLLLYNPTAQRPVIGEYKSESDSMLDYAFIQALTYASELLPPHQMERFYRSYISESPGDYLPLSKDFAHAPSRTSPEVELLLIYDRGAQKQEKTIPTVQKWIKEILAADVGVKAVTIATYDKEKPATDVRFEQTHFFSKDEVSTERKPLPIRPPALQPIA